MRNRFRFAAPLVLALLLGACAAEQPIPPASLAAPVQPQAQAPAPARSPADVLADLNILVNDTAPASAQYDARRAALTPDLENPLLDANLRRVLAQVLAFDPPRLRQRWEDLKQAQENAAALYAANPPEDSRALEGARVLRRLGPALYLVRLPSGDTALFSTTRRYRAKALLKGVAVAERPRPKPDASKGDLVDELADQPRTFDEITRQEAKNRQARRAPALAQLRQLDARGNAVERDVATDLKRLDLLTRDANAVMGPLLLPQAGRPAPATLIRKVKRLGKTYSRGQYYRYALPVTGQPQVDLSLKNYLEERRAEVQDLLRATGVGRGRMRVNVDRIAFTAYTAAPALLSIRVEELRDTGGAHPNPACASFVFDLKRQTRLGLGQLFTDVPAALAVLSELAARRMELAVDGNLFPEGLEAKAENFSIFVLDGADLVFTFPPYQVASYAQGAQTLRVPLFHPRLLGLLTGELKGALEGR